jgi:uncharacterized protein
MRFKMGSLIGKFVALSAVLSLLGPVSAQVPGKPAGYVTDSARVLSSDSVSLLATRCGRFDQAHRAQIAVVTVTSLKGEPIEKAALDLFKKWGLGRKGTDDGLLLLLSVEDRKSRITVGYGLEKTITNSAAASILDAMKPDLGARRYAAALDRALDLLDKLLPAGQ